jgi:hypothetical protein
LIEALLTAASLATLNHSGVAILAASPQLNPKWQRSKGINKYSDLTTATTTTTSLQFQTQINILKLKVVSP